MRHRVSCDSSCLQISKRRRITQCSVNIFVSESVADRGRKWESRDSC